MVQHTVSNLNNGPAKQTMIKSTACRSVSCWLGVFTVKFYFMDLVSGLVKKLIMGLGVVNLFS